MIKRFLYSIKQGFLQIFRNGVMSLVSIFSITAMLLILGVFFILVVNINMITDSVRNDYDTVEIFMAEDSTQDDVNMIIQTMQQMDGVKQATFRTKEEALEIMKEDWGDQAYLLEELPDNPLPNSVVIEINQIEKSEAIAAKAKEFNGIEKVNYYKDTVEKIMKVTDFVKKTAFILMIFLVAVSVIVVSNTIRLTVLARGTEIEIMKYVGATNWFVRGPFLIEGIVLGLFSAIISVGVISLIYYKIVQSMGDDMMIILSTPIVPFDFLIANTVVIFLAIGVSIGACGSIISMRRFLNV